MENAHFQAIDSERLGQIQDKLNDCATFGSDLSPEAADSFLESKNHSASGNINLLSFRSFAVFRRRVLCIDMGPSAGVAYELADRRLKPVLTRSSVA